MHFPTLVKVQVSFQKCDNCKANLNFSHFSSAYMTMIIKYAACTDFLVPL